MRPSRRRRRPSPHETRRSRWRFVPDIWPTQPYAPLIVHRRGESEVCLDRPPHAIQEKIQTPYPGNYGGGVGFFPCMARPGLLQQPDHRLSWDFISVTARSSNGHAHECWKRQASWYSLLKIMDRGKKRDEAWRACKFSIAQTTIDNA